MAYVLVRNINDNTFEFRGLSLQDDWNTSYYTLIGCSTGSCSSSGQTYRPSGMLEQFSAPSSGTDNYTPYFEVSHGMAVGESDIIYFWVYTPNAQKYFLVDSEQIDIPAGGLNQLGTPSIDYIDEDNPTQLLVKANYLANADYFDFEIYTTGGSYISGKSASASVRAVTFTGLTPNTTYKIKTMARATNYEDSAWSSFVFGTTASELTPPTNVSVYNVTQTTATLSYTPMPDSSISYGIWLDGNHYTDISTSPYTITGLTPNTTYSLTMDSYDGTNVSSETSPIIFTTLSASAPWEWWSNVLQGQPFMVSRDEWLAFQNKINTIRAENGLSNYVFTTSTTYVSTGKDMTASLMNECINAINPMMVGSMATVSIGQEISSTFMIGIKNNLNSCI